MKRLYALGMAYLGLVVGLVAEDAWTRSQPIHLETISHPSPAAAPSTSPARSWFGRLKSRCNALEVAVAIKRDPPPRGRDGVGYAAACHALAGKIDAARSLILGLPAGDRAHAAGIVFGIGHPIADQGDDESAGPIMELVIEFQPDNFMALYHAGMSEFILGQHEKAGVNMRRFLEIYHRDDGWRRNAEKVLRRLDEAKERT